MELRDGMFAVKLCELEHQYGLLRSRLELCQGADHEKIRHLLADVLDDYRENALLLEQSAEGCRSRRLSARYVRVASTMIRSMASRRWEFSSR